MMKTNDRHRQARENLLESLNYPRMNERKNVIHEKHDGTYEWVFEGLKSNEYSTSDSKPRDHSDFGTTSDTYMYGPEYWSRRQRREKVAEAKRNQTKADLLGWLQGDRSGTFWISGKPGSGKSTFVKSTTLLAPPSSENRRRCFMFVPSFCAKTPGLRRKHDETDWDMEELKRHLMALRSSNRSYLILLDGLDEMAKPHRGLRELFNFLDELTKDKRIKLCISSCPERIFLDRFSSYQRLRMHDVNFEDICDFTMESLKDLGLKPHDRMLHLIAQQILDKADGVFFWVHLALRNVRNGVEELDEDWDDVYQRILELPPELMKLYKDMWSRLNQRKENYVEMAALYFNITCWADTGLTLACLAVASDNSILENFTEWDELPTPMALVKRCNHIHKTLFPVCAGMLETQSSFSDLFPHQRRLGSRDDRGNLSLLQENDVSDLYLAIEKWESEAAHVRFTHRTAIDFIDSVDGQKLFGKYTTSYETIHSSITNAAIILELNFSSLGVVF
ncbi:hypothetical protein CSAL01_02823 [Colletotrichum salicis]|uniref:NACHT domain-containing protein n=1 Tax=Colletotrichum salicis TaxID=1209931 RepID=A0A135SZJ9_9PEZI|nr:hypothetical protein CSAL01_02823 [Colletotrichum salicis]